MQYSLVARRGRGGRRESYRHTAKVAFECGTILTVGESLTLDHIVPRARGDYWETINLQPLCLGCQKTKADLPVGTVLVALDMLVRPLPSDGSGGPVW